MEATIDMTASIDEIFHDACVDSGEQLAVICLGQAIAYCRLCGGDIAKSLQPLTFRFWENRFKGIGKLKIRVPFNASHILDVIADDVDVQISFLAGLDVLTQLKAILNFENNIILSPTVCWDLPLSRKLGHHYI